MNGVWADKFIGFLRPITFFGIVLVCSAGSASAQSYTANTFINADCGITSVPSNSYCNSLGLVSGGEQSVVGSANLVTPSDSAYALGQGHAAYSVFAKYGSLGVLVGLNGAISPTDPNSVDPTNPTLYLPHSVKSAATVSASFLEWITFSGPEAGSPLNVGYSFDISGFFESDLVGTGSSASNVQVDFLLGSTSGCYSLGGRNPNCIGFNLGEDGVGGVATLSGTFAAISGVPNAFLLGLSVSGELTVVNTYVGEPAYLGSSGYLNVAFDNTLLAYLTPLDPSVTMISSSGHDYSMPTPVPEPEIYAMMGLGLGLLGWVGRRKKLEVA